MKKRKDTMSRRGTFWLSVMLTVSVMVMIASTVFVGIVMSYSLTDLYPYVWFSSIVSAFSSFASGFVFIIVDDFTIVDEDARIIAGVLLDDK